MTCASWAMRFAASLDNVVTVLSGMDNINVMQDNILHMKKLQPLSIDEKHVLGMASKVFHDLRIINCTACGYCLNHCVKEINIPKILELTNLFYLSDGVVDLYRQYKVYTAGDRMASKCINCNKCSSHCPQKLEIPKLLSKSSNIFEQ